MSLSISATSSSRSGSKCRPITAAAFRTFCVSDDTRCILRSSTTRTVSGTLDIVEVEIARPLVTRVEQPSFFLQVPEQLGDEERIAAGVIGERPHEPGRRVWLAERCEHAAALRLA